MASEHSVRQLVSTIHLDCSTQPSFIARKASPGRIMSATEAVLKRQDSAVTSSSARSALESVV